MPKLKYYKIIKRETKTGITLRVKHENTQYPFGFTELGGFIHSEGIEQATKVLKLLIKVSLEAGGFVWK